MEKWLVMGWLSFMSPLEDMEVRLSAVFRGSNSRGRCWPLSACRLTAAFLILFSLGQRCNVNTNEIEPRLLTGPLQGKGEREIQTVPVCVWVQQSIMYLLVLITWIAHFRSWFIILSLRLYCILSCNQEDLIQCTDPDSLQVSTKDMDSTLSKASRAIKKTSKKVKAEELVSHH